MSFASLGLMPELVTAVSRQGYDTPSPIQAKAIPVILKGQDVMAAAQTGTGKTAGFALPLLQRLSTGKKAGSNRARALILTPTRELAAQVDESIKTYAQYTTLRTTVVYGGVKINPQMQRLRSGTDILVATPGRLLDLVNSSAISFKTLEILVLDEADRMLDMGFIHDISSIMELLPKRRQTLMFSATFSPGIRHLGAKLLRKPHEISVGAHNEAAATVEQWICPVDKKEKPELFMHLLDENDWDQVLVFCLTKNGTDRLVGFLKDHGVKASAIHGDKPQSARTRALADFQAGKVRVLVATDLAARGLDIDQLPQVVNFDLPIVAADYIHRIGRTGRAGASGIAISLVCADEFKLLTDIEHLTGRELKRKFVDGFEPNHNLPQSNMTVKIKKPKKTRVKGKQKNKRQGSAQSSGRGRTSTRVNSKKKVSKKTGARGKNTARGKKKVSAASSHKQQAAAAKHKKPRKQD